MSTISKFDDTIDSRDVIKRIDELQSYHDDLVEEVDSCEGYLKVAISELGNLVICPTVDDWPKTFDKLVPHMDDMDLDVWRKVWAAQLAYEDLEEAQHALKDEDPDDVEELKVLLSLQEQAEGYCDWHYGETLIREGHFETYAESIAEDLGYTDRDVHWPHDCIDWEKAARELRVDYTSVDFDGETFLVRTC